MAIQMSRKQKDELQPVIAPVSTNLLQFTAGQHWKMKHSNMLLQKTQKSRIGGGMVFCYPIRERNIIPCKYRGVLLNYTCMQGALYTI